MSELSKFAEKFQPELDNLPNYKINRITNVFRFQTRDLSDYEHVDWIPLEGMTSDSSIHFIKLFLRRVRHTNDVILGEKEDVYTV